MDRGLRDDPRVCASRKCRKCAGVFRDGGSAGKLVYRFCQNHVVCSVFGSHYRDRLFIEELAVDEAHRNRGLGRQLALSAAASLTESYPEATEVVLDVDRNNIPAVALYSSLGFSPQDFYTVARLYH